MLGLKGFCCTSMVIGNIHNRLDDPEDDSLFDKKEHLGCSSCNSWCCASYILHVGIFLAFDRERFLDKVQQGRKGTFLMSALCSACCGPCLAIKTAKEQRLYRDMMIEHHRKSLVMVAQPQKLPEMVAQPQKTS